MIEIFWVALCLLTALLLWLALSPEEDEPEEDEHASGLSAPWNRPKK